MFLAEVLLGPDLKTEVVHNIVAVGSTTPPPLLPPFFQPPPVAPSAILLSFSLFLLPAYRPLARPLDGPFLQLKPKESTER